MDYFLTMIALAAAGVTFVATIGIWRLGIRSGRRDGYLAGLADGVSSRFEIVTPGIDLEIAVAVTPDGDWYAVGSADLGEDAVEEARRGLDPFGVRKIETTVFTVGTHLPLPERKNQEVRET